MKIYKIYFSHSNGHLVLKSMDEVCAILKEDFEKDTVKDDVIAIKIGEMTEEEFKNLPEHDGW